MYIGRLFPEGEITFTHADSPIPLAPEAVENGVYTFSWKKFYDTAIDVRMSLADACFVGAVCVTLPEKSVTRADVLLDGKLCATHRAENECATGGTLNIPVGMTGKAVTLRLFTNLVDLSFELPEILGAHDDKTPLVWPQPQSIAFAKGFVRIKDVVPASDDPDEVFAADFLKQTLTERLGSRQAARGATVVFKKDAKLENERYTVKHTRGKVTVKAATRLTLLFGADTVLQLCDKKGLRRANVDDRPSHPMRGFHMGLPHRDQFEFTRRLFRYVLLPLRINTVFVEFAGGMRFDRHPAISEGWLRAAENFEKGLQPVMPHSGMVTERTLLEKDEVREILGCAHELGLEVIPEVQSLGHVQYITYAYPEIAEIDPNKPKLEDIRKEDVRPADFYAHSYCPTHPKSMQIIHDIIDEIVEVAQPRRYVHIGHDEVYQIGVCERCRDKDPGDIFAKHVTDLHDYLQKKGLGTMLWADMLHPAPVRPYRTYTAVDKLPRDVVLLDFVWYFNIPLDIEDHLLAHGYKVGVGNLYSPNYPRAKQRLSKEGMLGGQLSGWVATKEQKLAENGKFFDLSYLSQMLWNLPAYDERNRTTYNHLIAKHIQPAMRDLVRGTYHAAGYREAKLALPRRKGGVPAPLAQALPRAIAADGVTVEINGKFDKLVLEHATAWPAPRIAWGAFVKVGEYTVTYEDGSTECISVDYAKNVLRYDRAYAKPLLDKFYRHQALIGTWFADPVFVGKSERGEDLLTTGLVWENPHPEKTIAKITYNRDENDAAGLILCSVKGLNKK